MVRKSTTPRPPAHLSTPAKAWWKAVMADYVLESHHVMLLTKAAEAWDRAEAARVFLDENGVTFEDRFEQPKARPEVAIERDSRIAFARLVRELCLDVEDGPRPIESRPPRRTGRE